MVAYVSQIRSLREAELLIEFEIHLFLSWVSILLTFFLSPDTPYQIVKEIRNSSQYFSRSYKNANLLK